MRTMVVLLGVALLIAAFAYQDAALTVWGCALLVLAAVGSVCFDVGRDEGAAEAFDRGFNQGYEVAERDYNEGRWPFGPGGGGR